MPNPLLIFRRSLARIARLRHWMGSLNPWVELGAALVTLVVAVIIPIIALFGDFALGGDDEEASVAGAVATMAPDSGAPRARPPGGTPDDILGVLAMSASAASGYFVLDSLGLSSDGSRGYSWERFMSVERERREDIRWVALGQASSFRLSFTITNTSERKMVLISDISLRLEDTEPPPTSLRIGCLAARGGGGWQDIVSFDEELNSELVGVDHTIRFVSKPGTLLELGPDNLQRFEGTLRFSSPGLHRLRIVVDYETSGGRSDTIVSAPVEFLLMPSADGVERIAPDVMPSAQCP